MNVAFMGRPRELFERDALAIAASADGRPFTCVVSHGAHGELAGDTQLSPAGQIATFEGQRPRFRAILGAKLRDASEIPLEVSIVAADLRDG